MSDNAYQRYLKMKALSEFWEGLSDSDKQILSNSLNIGKNENEIGSRKQVVECRDPYFRGVSQNIVGDAIYDIGLHMLKRLIGKL